MKFKLNSKLDYRIVEAIYQYSFNNENTTNKYKLDFDYLDEVKIKAENIKFPNNKNFKRWYKIEKKEKIVDIISFKIRKQTWLDFIKNIMSQYNERIEEDYLVMFLKKKLPKSFRHYGDKIGNQTDAYFSKEEIIDKLSEIDSNSKKIDDLFKIFELDNKKW